MAGDLLIQVVLPLQAAVQLLHRQPALPSLEPAPEGPTQRQTLQSLQALLRRDRVHQHGAGQFGLLFRPDAPHLLQVETGLTAALELLQSQGITIDRQPLAHFLQQAVQDQEALLTAGLGQERMALLPIGLVLGAVHQLGVVDLQQPQLLQVGVGEPPALAQIHQQPVLQNPPQCLAALLFHVGFHSLGGDEVVG